MRLARAWRPVLLLLLAFGIGSWITSRVMIDPVVSSSSALSSGVTTGRPYETVKSQKKERRVKGDPGARRQIEEWRTERKRELGRMEMRALMGKGVGKLSLDEVRNLLVDPGLFANEGGEDPEDPFAGWRPRYPWRMQLEALLWERYGLLAPEEALERAFVASVRPEGHRASSAVLAGVAQVDPERAMAFVLSPPRGALQEFGEIAEMGVLMAALVRHSPDEAFEFVAKVPEALRLQAGRGFLDAQDSGTDWQALAVKAQEWAAPGDREAIEVLSRDYLAGRWAIYEPEAAMDWLLASTGDDIPSYETFFQAWLDGDPESAAAGLQAWFPVERAVQREQVVVAAVGRQLLRDPEPILTRLGSEELKGRAVCAVMLQTLEAEFGTKDLERLRDAPSVPDEARKVVIEVLEQMRAEDAR